MITATTRFLKVIYVQVDPGIRNALNRKTDTLKHEVIVVKNMKRFQVQTYKFLKGSGQGGEASQLEQAGNPEHGPKCSQNNLQSSTSSSLNGSFLFQGQPVQLPCNHAL